MTAHGSTAVLVEALRTRTTDQTIRCDGRRLHPQLCAHLILQREPTGPADRQGRAVLPPAAANDARERFTSPPTLLHLTSPQSTSLRKKVGKRRLFERRARRRMTVLVNADRLRCAARLRRPDLAPLTRLHAHGLHRRIDTHAVLGSLCSDRLRLQLACRFEVDLSTSANTHARTV